MRRLLTRALTGLALLGLLLSPVGRPAVAMVPGSVQQVDAGAAVAMDMADMPCCPDNTAKPDCAKDCLLMATCLGKTFQGAHASAPPPPCAGASGLIARNDARPDGLAQAPPPRPPDV